MGSASRVTSWLASVDDEQRHLLRAVTLDGESLHRVGGAANAKGSLSFGIPALDAQLPQGLPDRGVIELAGREGLGGSTRFALQLCAAALQRHARSGPMGQEVAAWGAWVEPCADPHGSTPHAPTLHAPGVAATGIPLERFLVVRPPPRDVARVTARLVGSGQLAAVVVHRAGVLGVEGEAATARWDVAVRRWALASEQYGTLVILVSDRATARREALPVAMRIELWRPHPQRIGGRVTKDRRGVGSPSFEVPLSALRVRPTGEEARPEEADAESSAPLRVVG